MKWVQVRVPVEMVEEVREIVERKKLWVNEHEFIRDTIREKMSGVVSEAVINYIKTEKPLKDRAEN